MFRVSLFLLLSLPLVQGFGVARPAFQQRTALYAKTPEDEPKMETFTSIDMEDEAVDYPAIEQEPFFIGEVDEEPAISTKKEELSAKAQATMENLSAKAQDLVNDPKIKELSAKAQDFANDPKIKEISDKATEFTKDFLSNIFSQVGDKLKEMKKEKEMNQK